MKKLDDLDFSHIEDWQTFDEVEEKFPNKFTKSSLNWALRSRHTNGLNQIVKKFGKQNLIHLPGFSIWISEQ